MSPLPRPRTGPILAAAGLAAALVLSTVVWVHSHRSALAELGQRADGTLQLAVAALRGQIRRYDRLPGLIAQNTLVRDLLADPRNARRVIAANLYLKATAQLLEASDIYVMGLDGVTIAHSGFGGPASFVGGNFAFRPYFQDALARGAGRFYALGTTSGLRGYYFGAPVLQDDQPAGVLVFKVDLDAIEAGWEGRDYEVLVTDPEGIAFLSSRPDWRLAALRPQTPDEAARTEATRRYADRTPSLLEVAGVEAPGAPGLWRIDGAAYVVRSEAMSDADWTVHVLVPARPAEVTAATRAALAAGLAGLAVLAAAVVWQRRLRLAERLAVQAGAQAELERRVVLRTAELAAVNARLEAEVAERTAAEARLRAAQAELVQAGKLAALGQMSAALSHEFNQPLAAARNFAENAAVLLDRGRGAEARTTLDRVLALIDRMAELSRHLRNFACKPDTRTEPVDLAEAVAAALALLGWRLRALGVVPETDLPPLRVQAGPVRLQQVLVNILSNALDALEPQPAHARRLRLTAGHDPAADEVVLEIADSGPGIPAALAERIFDPFFSTKGPGKGLGLGLSISYNIVHDFGGRLTAGAAPEGGALFRLALPQAPARAEAAA